VGEEVSADRQLTAIAGSGECRAGNANLWLRDQQIGIAARAQTGLRVVRIREWGSLHEQWLDTPICEQCQCFLQVPGAQYFERRFAPRRARQLGTGGGRPPPPVHGFAHEVMQKRQTAMASRGLEQQPSVLQGVRRQWIIPAHECHNPVFRAGD
jgi:hypothetical protein